MTHDHHYYEIPRSLKIKNRESVKKYCEATRQYLEIFKKKGTETRYKTSSNLHSIFQDWDIIQTNKYGGTYHIITPVENDHRISHRTIFIVLALLAKNYISTLRNDYRKKLLSRES